MTRVWRRVSKAYRRIGFKWTASRPLIRGAALPQPTPGRRRRFPAGRKRTTRPRGMPTGSLVRGFRATPVLPGGGVEHAEPPEDHAVAALQRGADALKQRVHGVVRRPLLQVRRSLPER